MGTHPIFESDFDCLTDWRVFCKSFEKMVQNANGHSHPEGIDLDTSRTPSPISVNVKSDEWQDIEAWRAQVIPMTDQIRRLQTIIRDQESSRSDFVFSADRLIRLVVEEGLNQLPYKEVDVMTPNGETYSGLAFQKGSCGVSIIRSGEAMEQGLRDCCRSIRIGKILIQTDDETHKAQVYYAKVPPDVDRRTVLLMYPILTHGITVLEAVKVLLDHNVRLENIILLTLFATPHGIRAINKAFPSIRISTSEVHQVAPTHFCQKYFGTD